MNPKIDSCKFVQYQPSAPYHSFRNPTLKLNRVLVDDLQGKSSAIFFLVESEVSQCKKATYIWLCIAIHLRCFLKMCFGSCYVALKAKTSWICFIVGKLHESIYFLSKLCSNAYQTPTSVSKLFEHILTETSKLPKSLIQDENAQNFY